MSLDANEDPADEYRDKIDLQARELTESVEREAAVTKLLGMISTMPADTAPVFEAALASAIRLCDATFGNIYLSERGVLRLVASINTPPAFVEYRKRRPPSRDLDPNTVIGRVLATKTLAHVADVSKEQAYIERYEPVVASVELGGIRTLLLVPMLKDDELVGLFSVYRQQVRPFTDQQVELVRNFASQAVIAIEHVRLLNELRTRTSELEQSYALVRQQAQQVEEKSNELAELNQQLEQRVAEQVSEIERIGRLRRFLSPQIADLIMSSGTDSQLQSHRREVTALFCDLRDFTGFSESSAPEDVMALLSEYHGAIGKIIFQYGGTLERFAGDGVMVIFNDPVPIANPALQAVRMALELRAALTFLIERWGRLGHDLGFGIGISHGYATLGTIGFEGRFDYAAIGMVANVASRLCDEAQAGQILINSRVLMAVENLVTVELVGELTLKGVSRPLQVHNVIGEVSASG
jgi:adenylate cyclase